MIHERHARTQACVEKRWRNAYLGDGAGLLLLVLVDNGQDVARELLRVGELGRLRDESNSTLKNCVHRYNPTTARLQRKREL
jgi:hypothetical protein